MGKIILLKGLLHISLLAAIVALVWPQIVENDIPQPVKTDSYGYVLMGYNLYRNGVYSDGCVDYSVPCAPESLQPTSYREPAYSSLIALALYLYPETIERSSFFIGPTEMRPEIHAYLRKWTIGMNFILAAFSLGITYLLTKSWIPSYLTFYLLLTSSAFIYPIKKFMSENLAAALLTGAVFFALLAIQRRYKIAIVLSGLFYGLLILTKGIYFYGLFLFTSIPFFVYALKSRSLLPKSFLHSLLAFLAGVFITVAPWMARNYFTFGSAEIASRGGFMLTLRKFYNNATDEEYKAMFWYSTPLKRVLPPSEEDLEKAKRLDQNNPEGFYKSAGLYASEMRSKYGVQKGEKLLTKEAMLEILGNTKKYFAVSVPLAFQGMFLERGITVQETQILNDLEIGILLILPLIPLLALALLTGNGVYIVLIALPLFSIFFHALFSDSLPRYNFPIAPLLWISLVTIIFLPVRIGVTESLKQFKRLTTRLYPV